MSEDATNVAICALPGCDTVFEVKRKNQKYCQPSHGHLAGNARRRLDGADALFEQPRQFNITTVRSLPDGYKVMIVNDLQMPFHDARVLESVERFWNDFAPDMEIYNGDIFDMYSISAFDQNPSRRFQLQNEIDVCRAWLDRRTTANPSARRFFIEGNHEDRLRRWLWRNGPDISSLRSLDVPALFGLNEMGFEHMTYMSGVDILGFHIEHGHKAAGSSAYPTAVARWMAIKTGSSGMVGHTHRLAAYHFTTIKGDHTFYENGCLCRKELEFAPFPNWQHGFTYGIVHANKLHLVQVPIYPSGFRAEGEFYPVLKKAVSG